MPDPLTGGEAVTVNRKEKAFILLNQFKTSRLYFQVKFNP
jgi:hypothetical protein